MANKDSIEVCGLWECVSRDGEYTYYSGRAGGMKFLLFPNRYKEDGDNKPTFHLKVGEWVTKKED